MKYKISLIFLIIIVVLPIYATNEIPSWIKNNAKWWSEDQIDDSTFVKGVEYLIKIGIIEVNSTNNQSMSEKEIPSWIKNNAKWWSEDQIDDSTFVKGVEYLIKIGIIEVNKNQDVDQPKKIEAKISEFFRVWVYENDIYLENNVPVSRNFHFELIKELDKLYNEIGIVGENVNIVVILPVFTSSAYSERGFYDYYHGMCEDCTTTNIVEKNFLKYFEASQVGARVLEVLGYKTITDIDVDKNPDILSKYDKIIVLHSEYVTQREFDAITAHPHVIYLYPNALYAKVDVNYNNNTITLIRGHGYPDESITNGFDWKYDNTHPYEADETCANWKFYDIPNGKMLNCYPEKIFLSDKEFLKTIKGLVS